MRSAAVAFGLFLFRPLLLIVSQIGRFGNIYHEIKTSAAIDEVLAQLTAEDVLRIHVYHFIVQILLVMDEPAMDLAEQLTAHIERCLAVVHVIDGIGFQQEHREGALLEITAGALLCHSVVRVVHGKESGVETELVNHILQGVDTRTGTRVKLVLNRQPVGSTQALEITDCVKQIICVHTSD